MSSNENDEPPSTGYPHSRYIEEVQFRRAEYFYARKNFPEAKSAYKALVDNGAGSSYYELALYKLGWTCYKQDQYEEDASICQAARSQDRRRQRPDHPKDSFDEKRIEDIFRVMSLSFSNLGGADAIGLLKHGSAHETNAYKNLGITILISADMATRRQLIKPLSRVILTTDVAALRYGRLTARKVVSNIIESHRIYRQLRFEIRVLVASRQQSFQ